MHTGQILFHSTVHAQKLLKGLERRKGKVFGEKVCLKSKIFMIILKKPLNLHTVSQL